MGFMVFFDSHHECNICKKSCLEMASVGIETLLKAILERTDRLVRNIGTRDHSKCTDNGGIESNLRWKTLRWKRGDNGLPDAVVHRGQVWRLWRPTKLGVLKVRLLPVPRGRTVVAWCVVLLPHNWRWDERHRWRVIVLQNATVNVAVDLARVFDKERAQ